MKSARVLFLVCCPRRRVRRSIHRRPRPAGLGSSVDGRGHQPVRVAALPADRTGVDVGPDHRPRRLRAEPLDLLRRHRARRRVENHQRRHHLRGAVPGAGADLDRRHHGVAEQSGSGVGRHRRVEQPPEHELGRRRLQVGRRRQDVAQHGPENLALHQPHRHRPAQQRHRDGRGDRQPVRTRRRARHLQNDRRRQDLEADPQGRRRHRRQRSGDGLDRQQDSVRVDVPAAPHRVLHERRRARAAACGNRPTAATRGASSPTVCRTSRWDASAST